MIKVSSAEQDKVNCIQQMLLSYRWLVSDYKACKSLYDELYPSGTIKLSDMPKNEIDTYEPERWAIKRIDMRDQMARSLDEMREKYEGIEKMISALPHDQHCVIMHKYMLGETYEQMEKKLNYVKRSLIRIHNRAINNLVTLCHRDS